MSVGRSSGLAALLGDGSVLIAGGCANTAAETYDPASGTFAPTGGMTHVRLRDATATTLRDGNVLIVGGTDASTEESPIASIELYDRATGRFHEIGSLAVARAEHTATLLADGRVLIAGGYTASGVAVASAEIWDPETRKTTATGSMSAARAGFTATLLVDGRVLVAGGSNDKSGQPLRSAEIWDPRTGRFAPTGSLASGRMSSSAVLLPDGDVLILGGNSSSVQEMPLATAELFDPRTRSFHATGSMIEARDGQTATLLANGELLIAGGGRDLTAELYNPASGRFTATGSLVVARAGQTATLLATGEVLIAGGGETDDSRSAELYQP